MTEQKGRSMRSAYIWTREHSTARLAMIYRLSWDWTRLLNGSGKLGRYASIQWLGESHISNRGLDKFEGIVRGRSVTIHLDVISAREWYARELYQQALAQTLARYPDFEAHRFVDGDRVGERRIEFLNQTHALSKDHLYISLWEIAKEANPQVQECIFFEPCDDWGNLLSTDEASEKSVNASHLRARLILNVKDLSDLELKRKIAEVVASLKRGNLPQLSEHSVQFSFDEIRDGFVELSNPELVLLNWEDALPALTEADKALWKAAAALDAEGLEQALTNGANVNSIRSREDGVLSSVMEAWGDYRYGVNESYEEPQGKSRSEEYGARHAQMLAMLRRLLDAGAHPDLHPLDQVPAIVNAALLADPAVAALLLDYGADSTICPFWDEGPGGNWPAAWNFAHTNGFIIDPGAGAREVYYVMAKRGSSPCFTQVEEDEDRREAMLAPEERKWQPDGQDT